MRKYFVHLLKKNLLPLACFTLFCLIVYVVPISVQNYSYWNSLSPYDEYYQYIRPNLYYGNISTVLGILSVFIPIYMFSYKMNKRSVDMYYSLPVSKTKILVANFVTGLILLYASYTIAYVWGFVVIATKVQRIHLVYYICLYFASLIPAFILYSVTAFVYTRANTIIDGIISAIGALFVLALAFYTFSDMCHPYPWFSRGWDAGSFLPFAPLAQVDDIFGHAIVNGKVDLWFTRTNAKADICPLVCDIMWLLIAVGATVGLILSEKNSKAENCGQISSSIFCYKTQIPAYTAILVMLLLTISGEAWAILLAVSFGAFVLSIVYKRSIKIGWKFAVVLASCIVGAIVLCVINNAIIDTLRLGYYDEPDLYELLKAYLVR